MITVLDYNMGNLRSVSKAVEHLGGKVRVSSNPKEVLDSDKVILPGVGAFGDACEELHKAGLFEAIRQFAKTGKPFLGICLGLQLLFETSEESPNIQGLGILKGSVQKFRSTDVKIPHMGWNDSKIVNPSALLKNLPEPAFFYFVHTYYAVPKDPKINLMETRYGSETFPAIIGSQNIFATQFHPEKSQDAGLTVLKNFINL